MTRVWIDNLPVDMPAGSTILDAAAALGIEIPTMCFLRGQEACTSCFVCVVKVEGASNLLPACATIIKDAMRVRSRSPEVIQARRTALELLLSDHVGDCMAPCHTICPAGMNIPLVLRHLAGGDLRQAIAAIRQDLPLPAVTGRICTAPCEKGCRRALHDQAVSIRLLERRVAEADLFSPDPYVPPRAPDTGKSVAIVGAGPTGLAAAFELTRLGHQCTLYDEHPQAGGMLRYAVAPDRLPPEVLNAEIALIGRLGACLELGRRIGRDIPLGTLRRTYDAVLLATGVREGPGADLADLVRDADVEEANLFAAGNGGRGRLAVRAMAEGKNAAGAINLFLQGRHRDGVPKPFTCRMGAMQEGEMERFLSTADNSPRQCPGSESSGLGEVEARTESQRCLHCDCRKAGVGHGDPYPCKLRLYAEQYEASANRYRSKRRAFQQQLDHSLVIYEPGKCIACGLCLAIARAAGEEVGLAFIGRGFDVRVGVPFNHPLAKGLVKVAAQCAHACPTAAISLKDK